MVMPICAFSSNTVGSFPISTNVFTYVDFGGPTVGNRPDDAYWGVTSSSSNYGVALKPGKFYQVNTSVIWDVQAAGQRELSLVAKYKFTDPSNDFDAAYRLQTLPGAPASYVEMATGITIPTAPILDGSVTSITLGLRAWQNSTHTVNLLAGTTLSVLELDV